MPPLKLTIAGSFWDSQIYAGRLYLFSDSGSIKTLDWDKVIGTWTVEKNLRLALECAFRRSDYLYAPDFKLLLHDPDVKDVVKKKFSSLANYELTLNPSQHASLIGEQDNLFPFPHSDCQIYKNQMYVGAATGLFKANCDKRTIKPVSSKIQPCWEGPSLSLSASYGEIAVASGEYGLYEIPADLMLRRPSHPTISSPCNRCSWNFQSLFCTYTGRNEAQFADFEKQWSEKDGRLERRLTGTFSAEDIFEEPGFTWSRQDKFYSAGQRGLQVATYIPWGLKKDRLTRSAEIIPLTRTDEVTDGGVANFGTVLEYDDAICVLLSDGEVFWIEGDPVSWRIFPKSVHYENQLHVIFDDHLDIYSFNQDYFEDQETKVLGTRHLDFRRRGSWRSGISPLVLQSLDGDDDLEAEDYDPGEEIEI